jgi:hypothetical protein
MVKKLAHAALLVGLVFFTCGAPFNTKAAAGAEATPSRKYVAPSEFSARDGDGVLWSFPPYRAQAIAYWTGDDWNLTDFLPAPETRGIGMWTRSDGVVVALWSAYKWETRDGGKYDIATDTYFLTAHRGKESKVLSKFQIPTPKTYWVGFNGVQSFRFPDSPLFMAIGGRDLYRISDEGEVKKLFTAPAPPSQQPKPDAAIKTKRRRWGLYYNEFIAAPAGDNRIWFSQIGDWDLPAWPRFTGLLCFENDAINPRLNFPGLPLTKSSPIEAISSTGGPSVFAALQNKGLFEISSVTLRAKSIALPEKGTFGNARQLWGNDGDLYVVVGPKQEENLDRTQNHHTLWRRRSGRWKKLIVGLDRDTSTQRQFQKTSEGLWVNGEGLGLWFIGPDDKAQLVDWKRGLGLGPTGITFGPVEGNSFRVSNRTETELVPGFAAFKNEKPAPDITSQRFFLNPVQSQNLHIWTVLGLADHALQEWNGSQWIKHPFPRKYQVNSNCELALDERDRVWVLPDEKNGATIIFDPATAKWHSYPSIFAAVLTNRNSSWPTAGLYPNGDNLRQINYRPVKGPNNEIALVGSEKRELFFYDGKEWESWKAGNIYEEFAPLYFDNPPFFGKSGRLCLAFNGKVFQFLSTGWEVTTYEKDPHFETRQSLPTSEFYLTHSVNASLRLLEDGTLDPEPMTYKWEGGGFRDREGTSWLFKNGNLYRARPFPTPSIAVPVVSAATNHPFYRGSSLYQVLVDTQGNTFFNLRYDFATWILLKNTTPLPETILTAQHPVSDSLAAQFSVKGTKPFNSWFSWRLDGKAWSEPTKQSDLSVEGLKPGPHVVEVYAIDSGGTRDHTPAFYRWEVKFDSVTRIAELIEQLSNSDFNKREAAIPLLARQHEKSLPLLREALEAAKNKDAEWWLKAAIAEAERWQMLK